MGAYFSQEHLAAEAAEAATYAGFAEIEAPPPPPSAPSTSEVDTSEVGQKKRAEGKAAGSKTKVKTSSSGGAGKSPAPPKLATEAKPKAVAAPKPKGPFSDGSKLQVLLESGWTDCSEDEMVQIGNQLAMDTKKFAIQARGAMYIVDFTDPDNITQTNPMTKNSRK